MKAFTLAALVFIVCIGGLACANAAAAEEKPAGERFGERRAVTAFDAEEGFKLSDRALTAMGVRFAAVKGSGGRFSIPRSALVRLKATTGVYRRFDGWIAYVLVDVIAPNGAGSGETFAIRSADLQEGDELAVGGTDFLRMTEVDLTTDTVAGCAH